MEFLSEDPGQDKAADTEFFRETFQGQFLRVVGIQIEKQSLLQFQVICVFTHLQRQRWQQVCQQECEIPFRIDLYIGRCGTILFHGSGQCFKSLQGNTAVL